MRSLFYVQKNESRYKISLQIERLKIHLKNEGGATLD